MVLHLGELCACRYEQQNNTSVSSKLSFTMLSLATLMSGVILAIANLSTVGAAPSPFIGPRQNGYIIQNWANDYADVDFVNGAAGAYSVKWDNNPGGNFVVGKGYRPARDM
jgi:endo-1,4-beta-xylanase